MSQPRFWQENLFLTKNSYLIANMSMDAKSNSSSFMVGGDRKGFWVVRVNCRPRPNAALEEAPLL